MSNFYSVKDILDEANKRFHLENFYDNIENYNIQFRRVLNDSGIWEKGVLVSEINGETDKKKNERLFTKSQMEDLFAEKRIYNYVRKHSKLEKFKNAPRYDDISNEIKSRRKKYIDYLNEQENNNETYDGEPYISQEELISKRNSLMIEAIFNLFFTEFDINLFEHDLDTLLCSDELELTPKTLEAENRLKNPEQNYYSKKKTVEYFLNHLQDVFH